MPRNQSLNKNNDDHILNRRDDVNFREHDLDDVPSVDRSGAERAADDADIAHDKVVDQTTAYGSDNRKHKADIDGPQQESQETDDVYQDSRSEQELPKAGKRVDQLSAFDLSKEGNK